uniref:RING-CH-type domain-containing protein n=1 Tax=Vitis vinifera TaxID=29760 RepID=F6HH65_VITVI
MKSIGELKNLVGLSPGLSSFWVEDDLVSSLSFISPDACEKLRDFPYGFCSNFRVLIFDSSRVWNVILFFWKQASSMKGEVQLEPSGERNPRDSDPLLENQADSSTGSSSEINSEDIEAGSVPCCRICLECDGEPDDELISPCMCKGTQQFVHRSCLDHWRSVKEGFAFSHCTTCKAQYHLQVALFEDNSWRKIKFRLFVARDVFLVFLAVQTVIGAMGGFAYIMDKDGAFRNSFSDGWDRILSRHPIPFYYCIETKETRRYANANVNGVLAFFVLLGFFGLILHCSSLNSNDPHMAGCQNCCYGWGILDCFPASMEACFALVIVFVVIFAILGVAYGFLAATMAIQRIWQRHYHILTKRELTKEYIVEDLRGCYTPPKLDPEHEERLKMLKLL